jgi:hypothetical protein
MSSSRFRTHLVVRQRQSGESPEKAVLVKKERSSRDVQMGTAIGSVSRSGYFGVVLRSQFARVRLGEIRTHVRTH